MRALLLGFLLGHTLSATDHRVDRVILHRAVVEREIVRVAPGAAKFISELRAAAEEYSPLATVKLLRLCNRQPCVLVDDKFGFPGHGAPPDRPFGNGFEDRGLTESVAIYLRGVERPFRFDVGFCFVCWGETHVLERDADNIMPRSILGDPLNVGLVASSDVSAQFNLTDRICETQILLRRVGGALSFVGPRFGVPRRLSRVVSSSSSSGERQQAYERADIAENPSGLRSTLGRIGSLPLSAKIGVTVVLALAAWALITLGFIRLLSRSRYIIEGAGYILIGSASWLSTSLLWIGGS